MMPHGCHTDANTRMPQGCHADAAEITAVPAAYRGVFNDPTIKNPDFTTATMARGWQMAQVGRRQHRGWSGDCEIHF